MGQPLLDLGPVKPPLVVLPLRRQLPALGPLDHGAGLHLEVPGKLLDRHPAPPPPPAGRRASPSVVLGGPPPRVPIISSVPWKIAPSCMMTRGLAILPVTRALACSSTQPDAVTVPFTVPPIVIASPWMVAFPSARSPLARLPFVSR